MTEKRLSLGINVSILLILMIFGILLFLPLRLLFDTKYYNWNTGNENNVTNPKNERESALLMDHRKLKRCPNLRYESRLISVFLNDYDRNCTYVRNKCDCDSGSEERRNDKRYKKRCRSKSDIVNEVTKENSEEILKERQMKSVTVAGHILVTMLLVSVIAALVEVLRVRFTTEKVLRHILQKFFNSCVGILYLS